MRSSLAVALVVTAASTASADIAITKGGPSSDDGKALAGGALGEAAKAMAVCWRAQPSGPQKVTVAIAANGAVTAKAVTKGAAAQCAAGILAVWTIPGGPWKGEVAITAGASATPSTDLATTIQQQLIARSAPIKACQSKAPGKSGSAQIKMKIAPDGSIGEVAVSSKLGTELDRCVTGAVTAIKLAPTSAAGAVSYQLAVAFSGKVDAVAPATGPEAPGGATVGGGLGGAQVEVGVAKLRESIARCVDAKVAKGKRAVVRFTIRTDGTAKNVVVKESSGDGKVDTCIEKGFTGLTFPAANEETKVSLPLAF